MSLPPHKICPLVGTLLPDKSSNSVVLPAPFGPITPIISGRSTLNDPSRLNVCFFAIKPREYVFLRFRTSRIGCVTTPPRERGDATGRREDAKIFGVRIASNRSETTQASGKGTRFETQPARPSRLRVFLLHSQSSGS